MIEAPEALLISEQLDLTIFGKRITYVSANNTPHKFAWYYGNPDNYSDLLLNKIVGKAHAYGGQIEIEAEDTRLLFTDGINLKYYHPGEKLPNKHQLLIGFEDESCLLCSVRMYGGLWCFPAESFDCNFSSYRDSAHNKPQVLSEAFDLNYYLSLINSEEKQKKTAKAFLATEQTIPGLGNGVLQDILFKARIHPKTHINTLSDEQKEELYYCIKSILNEIYQAKGRNSETDLFGINGNYIPFLSKDTYNKPCPVCGETIRKETYLGGSIYYCLQCQK